MPDKPDPDATAYREGVNVESFFHSCRGRPLILGQFNEEQARFCMQWARYIDDIYGNPDDGTGFEHSSLGGILCLIAEHYAQRFPGVLYVRRTLSGAAYDIEDINESNRIREVGKVTKCYQYPFYIADSLLLGSYGACSSLYTRKTLNVIPNCMARGSQRRQRKTSCHSG
jgi:hypothetical protein